MKPLSAIRKMFGNSDRSTQLLAEIREGIANMADVMSKRLQGARPWSPGQGDRRTERLLFEIREGVADVADELYRLRIELAGGAGHSHETAVGQPGDEAAATADRAVARRRRSIAPRENAESQRAAGIPLPPGMPGSRAE